MTATIIIIMVVGIVSLHWHDCGKTYYRYNSYLVISRISSVETVKLGRGNDAVVQAEEFRPYLDNCPASRRRRLTPRRGGWGRWRGSSHKPRTRSRSRRWRWSRRATRSRCQDQNARERTLYLAPLRSQGQGHHSIIINPLTHLFFLFVSFLLEKHSSIHKLQSKTQETTVNWHVLPSSELINENGNK